MIFFTQQDYHRRIYDLLDQKPDRVWIASFNLHVGISKKGGVYDRIDSHRFLNFLNSNTKDSRVLIGLPELGELPKVVNAAEYFPVLRWKYSLRSHLKCWLFFYGRRLIALCGSRNLGDSNWADAVLEISATDSLRLKDFYNELWIESKTVPKTDLTLIETPR